MNTPEHDGLAGVAEEVRDALAMLQHYLSDQVPPMLFADSLEHLLNVSPALVGEQIQAWVAAQYRRSASLPISDYLFHAAKKVYLIKELQLVPRDHIETFLTTFVATLLHICPPEDRPHLQDDLVHLGDSQTVLAATVDVVHQRVVKDTDDSAMAAVLRSSTRAAGSPTPPPATAAAPLVSPAVVRGLRRFELLLQRLASQPAPSSATPATAVLAEAVAEAVGGAASSDELLQRLSGLDRLRGDAAPRQLLRLLGSRLPDWAPPTKTGGDATMQGAAAVMRKALDLTNDPVEVARRFEELVQAAAEEFNSGALGRAVTMLELAQDMLARRRVAPEAARVVQNRGETLLAPARLRAFAEDSDKVPLLRRALAFFSDLAPAELLARLEGEESRERRRHLLTLLAAHGEEARRLALNTLREAAAGSTVVSWQLERNLLYLLRRIPPPADHRPEDDLDVLVPLSQPGGPLAVVREALAGLGQIRTPRAEATMIARVSELEDAATGVRPLPYQPTEVLGLLDRAVGALARSTSPAARRCVVAHALKRKPLLGNTLRRAAELGEQDLSGDAELIERLLAAIREELPVKVLGVTLASGRKADVLEGLLALLAGTPAPAVRELLTSIVERFPGQPFADAATRALGDGQPPSASEPGPPTLSGDLELFGLPSLLQNLGESRLTGVLTLLDSDGAAVGTIHFLSGNIIDAVTGPLTGKAAVYQLLALSLARFAFVQEEPPAADDGKDGHLAVLPLVMEGMRRLDEYRRSCALLPDDAPLRATAQRPTRPAEEHDVALLRALWARVTAGTTAAECERESNVEFFRVRRALAHWLVEGAVELAPAPSPPAPPQTTPPSN